MDHQPQTFLVAIDPGASGGIAWTESQTEGPPHVRALKMPRTESEILQLLKVIGLKQPAQTPSVFLEQVGGYVGIGQPGSRAFVFGQNAGVCHGICLGLWGPESVNLVRPQVWQSPLGLGTARACGSKSKWKNKLKNCAEGLFPNLKITLSTSDALLILHWGLSNLNIPNE